VVHRRPAARRDRRGRPGQAPPRGAEGVRGRDGDARRRPDRDRRAGRRDRPGGARHGPVLRPRARAVRQADRGLPGDPVHARRHGDAGRRRAAADLARGVAQARGPAARPGRGDGEALRLPRRRRREPRRDPGARRLRLHARVPRRALLPRREDHGDLRGDERDPADRDRARSPPARRAQTRAGLGRLMPRAKDEPVRLTKIYTRGGDAGQTSLGDGSRVSKLDLRLAAYGTVDELNAALGVVLAGDTPDELRTVLERVQNELFDVGADLSVPLGREGRLRVAQSQIDRLEEDCDRFNAELPELRSFVLPGGTQAAAGLHVARTICRRAERETLRAAQDHELDPLTGVYLNRLSDLLFVLSRAANAAAGRDEPLWRP